MERELLDLEMSIGNRESINLNPTVMIHRNGKGHWLSIIYMNETTKQVSPLTYGIQEDGDGYFMHLNGKQTLITHDPILDILTVVMVGDYMRN